MNTKKIQGARGKPAPAGTKQGGQGARSFLFLLLIAHCSLLITSYSYASDLRIGRMKVSIMPEYDSPDVLVVYEGKFSDKDAFPNQATFTLPKGVTRLTDVCSLSPGGQHFCQLYDITDKGEYNETTVKLPYSDFFIDFQYSPFKVKSGRVERDFEYAVKSLYPIDALEVSIQEPLRAEDFKISPVPTGNTEKKGFKYHNYTYKDIKQGQDVKFKINYMKDDVKPSVDIKFSVMSKQGLIEKNKGIWLLAAGIAVLIVFLIIRMRRSHHKGTTT